MLSPLVLFTQIAKLPQQRGRTGRATSMVGPAGTVHVSVAPIAGKV